MQVSNKTMKSVYSHVDFHYPGRATEIFLLSIVGTGSSVSKGVFTSTSSQDTFYESRFRLHENNTNIFLICFFHFEFTKKGVCW